MHVIDPSGVNLAANLRDFAVPVYRTKSLRRTQVATRLVPVAAMRAPDHATGE